MTAKRKPRKIKKDPGLARPTAAERRATRSEAQALRQQINPPQLVTEIKRNQRALAGIAKNAASCVEIDQWQTEIKALDAHNKTNLALLRFVLPTLKSVEISSGGADKEFIIRILDEH